MSTELTHAEKGAIYDWISLVRRETPAIGPVEWSRFRPTVLNHALVGDRAARVVRIDVEQSLVAGGSHSSSLTIGITASPAPPANRVVRADPSESPLESFAHDVWARSLASARAAVSADVHVAVRDTVLIVWGEGNEAVALPTAAAEVAAAWSHEILRTPLPELGPVQSSGWEGVIVAQTNWTRATLPGSTVVRIRPNAEAGVHGPTHLRAIAPLTQIIHPPIEVGLHGDDTGSIDSFSAHALMNDTNAFTKALRTRLHRDLPVVARVRAAGRELWVDGIADRSGEHDAEVVRLARTAQDGINADHPRAVARLVADHATGRLHDSQHTIGVVESIPTGSPIVDGWRVADAAYFSTRWEKVRHHLRSQAGNNTVLDVTPAGARWRFAPPQDSYLHALVELVSARCVELAPSTWVLTPRFVHVICEATHGDTRPIIDTFERFEQAVRTSRYVPQEKQVVYVIDHFFAASDRAWFGSRLTDVESSDGGWSIDDGSVPTPWSDAPSVTLRGPIAGEDATFRLDAQGSLVEFVHRRPLDTVPVTVVCDAGSVTFHRRGGRIVADDPHAQDGWTLTVEPGTGEHGVWVRLRAAGKKVHWSLGVTAPDADGQMQVVRRRTPPLSN